jgi:hypothetical protein
VTSPDEWVHHQNVWVRFTLDENMGRWLIREIKAEDGDYLSATRLAKLRLADLEAVVNISRWQRVT